MYRDLQEERGREGGRGGGREREIWMDRGRDGEGGRERGRDGEREG